MTVDPAPIDIAPASSGGLRPRTIAILLAVAFVAGLILTGFAMTRWTGWRNWGGGGAVTQPLAAPAPSGQAAQPLDPGMPAQVMSVPDEGVSLVETAAREAQLAARMGALESRLATIDLRAQAASANAARAEGLLVAFAARRALDRGLVLGYIEGQLRDRFGATQPRAVAVTIQAARNPVTLEALRMGVDELAPELSTATAEASWWDSVKQELSTLVVLRKTGTPSPRPTDRLTRARRMLEGGQVDAALAEIARLPGRDKASAWMTAARRHIQARRALDVLETAAIVEPQQAAAAAAILPAPARMQPPPLN